MNEPKKLYRNTQNKMICGVCSGLGDYFNIDPTIVRLLFVVLSLLSLGTGLIAYIIMCIVVPEAPQTPPDNFNGTPTN